MSNELRSLQRDLRDWTTRPATRSPRVARTRVLARIEERRARPWWVLAAVTAGLVAVVAFGLFLRSPRMSYDPPVARAATEPSPGLLVYELESGTKLYMALAAATVQIPTTQRNSTKEGNG